MNIGDRIKQIRLTKGLTQQKLAFEIGKTVSSVKKYESGFTKPPIDVLEKIADAFVISLDELLNDETTSFSSKLITAILRMDYLSYIDAPGFSDFAGSDKDIFETISDHTGISVDSLKKCIEENTDLKTNEQIELIDYWNRWASRDDGVDLDGFLYDNYKEINKNLLLSKKVKNILNRKSEKDNTEELIDLFEDRGYKLNIESSDGISVVTISNEAGTISEMLEVDFVNLGNDMLESIEKFTLFSIDNFLKAHNGPIK